MRAPARERTGTAMNWTTRAQVLCCLVAFGADAVHPYLMLRLVKDGRVVMETASDNYGDFKFDKLEENSGRYVVEISAHGMPKKTVEADLGASINLGEIRL